jgi:hypothetical protein
MKSIQIACMNSLATNEQSVHKIAFIEGTRTPILLCKQKALGEGLEPPLTIRWPVCRSVTIAIHSAEKQLLLRTDFSVA